MAFWKNREGISNQGEVPQDPEAQREREHLNDLIRERDRAYDAALKAKDQFTRVQRGDTAKERDKEAERRAIERQQRMLALKAEIAEMEKKKTP